MVFGGEGLFFAALRGPGKVWLQSLPVSRLAARILQYGTVRARRRAVSSAGWGICWMENEQQYLYRNRHAPFRKHQ